jgi:hypothetical protein
MMGQETFLVGADSPAQSLLIPHRRSVSQHLGQPQPLWLPPIQDRLHNVRRQAGEWEQTADIGIRHAVLLGEVGDRLCTPALDPPPPAMRAPERLD